MKRIANVIVACAMILLATGIADAGLGRGGKGRISKGVCTIDIYAGTPMVVEGLVMSAGVPGGGIIVDTEEESVIVYGIGPSWFWEANGMAQPDVGDVVTVTAYAVEVSTGIVNIATEITMNGVTLLLRDPETGVPLWR